jgi:hypothetical protein
MMTGTQAVYPDLNEANDPVVIQNALAAAAAHAAAQQAAADAHVDAQEDAAERDALLQGQNNANIEQLKLANAEYKLKLVPLSHAINPAEIAENTIILKKDKKKGIVKAYLIQNGAVSKAITGLNLSAAEIEVMPFPDDDNDIVDIERQQFPELIDKVALRCGVTTNRFGSYSALVFALGCGITTVAALALIMTGPLFFVAATVLGLSTTVANWRMSRYDLPEIFNGGVNYLFNNKSGLEPGKYESISLGRKILLGIGIACSIAFGAAIAILTYSATIALPASFPFLAAASVFLPPVGITLAAVTLISLSVIMIKSMSDLAKSKSLVQTLKDAFNNIFHIDPVKDAGFLGHAKRIATWVLLTVVSAGALALTFLGAVFTLKSCMAGLNAALQISSAALNVVSTVVVRGLALVAQIPFTLMTTLNPILQLFYRWPEKPVVAVPVEGGEQQLAAAVVIDIDPDDLVEVKPSAFLAFLGAMASIINAVGNGLIALNGQKFDITTPVGIGTTGAIANSFASTFGNTISTDVPAPVNEQPAPQAEAKAEPVVLAGAPGLVRSSTAGMLSQKGFEAGARPVPVVAANDAEQKQPEVAAAANHVAASNNNQANADAVQIHPVARRASV